MYRDLFPFHFTRLREVDQILPDACFACFRLGKILTCFLVFVAEVVYPTTYGLTTDVNRNGKGVLLVKTGRTAEVMHSLHDRYTLPLLFLPVHVLLEVRTRPQGCLRLPFSP